MLDGLARRLKVPPISTQQSRNVLLDLWLSARQPKIDIYAVVAYELPQYKLQQKIRHD
ncbi:hypothetical protein RvY_03689 [Ramazzottius varieornatus]|uniref:Uncharacterized protein n=1 Tax=Ramazzottius varieornatus TaxID=947166 RepID=A0A1D1UZ47_RAMVA|nr:hypothetical protein RvY_03689 [Ramazzottius varieornatus]